MVYNIISGRRHLVCVLRKSMMCRCGCAGWCSVWPILRFIRWSLAALARKAFPELTVENAPWPAVEERRATLAGHPLLLRACCLQVKGDWAEFCGTLGFYTWAASEWPCLWCHTDRQSLYNLEGLCVAGEPAAATTALDYESACRRCEIKVRIGSQEEHFAIKTNLVFDKRKGGSRGRALLADLPAFQLLAGDRLEPSTFLADIGAGFDELAEFPTEVMFWRPSQETLTHHRNPMLDASLGITISSPMGDTLHCLYLGVFQVVCAHTFWMLWEHDAWSVGQAATEHERLQLSVLHLKNDLKAWYAARRHAHPAEVLTEIQDITIKMVGTKQSPDLAIKAAECKGFMLFAHSLWVRFHALCRAGPHMLAAATSIVRFIDCMCSSPVRLTAPQHQQRSQLTDNS